MTITRRLGIGYASITVTSLVLVVWLGYHEFVEEPASFAAMGLSNVHKDTDAELSTVLFLALVPVMLGFGWLWMRHVLAPLRTLARALSEVNSDNLMQPLARSGNGDELDQFTDVFNSMTVRLDGSIRNIREFTLHASHELKTPLTVMRAQLETVLRDKVGSPEDTRWIESQIDEVKRLARIVDSLTLLTKADAGLAELERRPIPLRELVEECLENAQILAQPHGLRVTLDSCEDSIIEGDRDRLRQLLLILTDNAVKYNRPRGFIRISLQRMGATSELRITNTAGEISPETLGNVFGRFVRGENARGTVEGSGLGLNIAQWIVEAHGGSIRLVPETGGLVTALVRLPCLADGSPSAPADRARSNRVTA